MMIRTKLGSANRAPTRMVTKAGKKKHTESQVRRYTKNAERARQTAKKL